MSAVLIMVVTTITKKVYIIILIMKGTHSGKLQPPTKDEHAKLKA